MTADSPIADRDGRPGLATRGPDGRVRVRLPNGVALDLPPGLVTEADGALRADVSFDELAGDEAGGTAYFQEVEERLRVGTAVRETGRVVARTVTETAEAAVEAAGWRETVEVERVPVGREVTSVEGVRDEDGVVVIPVYEEVLVVETRLVLREEVRLRTVRERTPGPGPVTVRRQRVEVDRLPPSPAPDPAPDPAGDPADTAPAPPGGP